MDISGSKTRLRTSRRSVGLDSSLPQSSGKSGKRRSTATLRRGTSNLHSSIRFSNRSSGSNSCGISGVTTPRIASGIAGWKNRARLLERSGMLQIAGLTCATGSASVPSFPALLWRCSLD